MRGSTFLAIFLILVGIVFLVATLRGRAPQLYEAITRVSGGATGTTGTPSTIGGRNMANQSTTRAPRKSS